MKVLKYLVCLVLPLIAGCANSDKTPEPVVIGNVLPLKSSGELVRAFVENNAFIDVDIQSLLHVNNNPASRSEDIAEEDFAKVTAAVYRFYKHVSIKDSMYVWDLNSGAEINISEDIFSAFTNNLNEANAAIKEWNAKGEKVELGEITEEYLESLLK